MEKAFEQAALAMTGVITDPANINLCEIRNISNVLLRTKSFCWLTG